MMKSIIILLALALVTGVQSSGGCGDNYDQDAAKKSETCSGSVETCSQADCCTVKLTCKALIEDGSSTCGTGKIYSWDAYNANDAATETTFTEKCCEAAGDAKICGQLASASLLTCGDGREPDEDKAGTAALKDDTDLATKCCKAEPAEPKCGSFVCAAGYNDKTGKAETECTGGACDPATCCIFDDDMCLSQMVPNGSAECATGTHFPESKHGTTHYDYDSQAPPETLCCVPGAPPITCNSFGSDSSVPKVCQSTHYNTLDDSTVTAATFNADCCKPKATCANLFDEMSGTLRAMPTFAVAAATGILAALL